MKSVVENATTKHRITVTLRGEGSSNPRFFIAKRLIERATGEKLQNGVEYELGGRIIGIGDFKMRHVEKGGSHLYLQITKKRSGQVKFGEKYEIEFDMVRQRREYSVINAKEGRLVKLPRVSVERLGFLTEAKQRAGGSVLDLRFSNPSDSEMPPRRFFATCYPKTEDLKLRVGIGSRSWATFRLEYVKEFHVSDFVRDFESHRCRMLRNVSLMLNKGNLVMKVEDRSFALQRPRLRTYALRVILIAEVVSTQKQIRFEFDGVTIVAKLFRDSPVLGLELDHGLVVKYDKGGGELRRFHLFDNFDGRVLDHRVRLVSSPQNQEGDYVAEVSSWLAEHVRARLSQISGKERLSREKGDMSEEIARRLLSMARKWEEVADSPISRHQRKRK